jgi:outer membrane lipoprotein SlyB
MNQTVALSAFICFLVLVAGCQSTLTGESYSRSEARKAQQVQYGMVEYLRPVMIEGTKTPIGAGAGAAVGGIAGSSVGSGKGAAVASVLGAVAGGVAGAAVEEQATKRQGVEITVRLDNNQIISVVQEVSPGVSFQVGDRVRVLTLNGTTRIAQ